MREPKDIPSNDPSNAVTPPNNPQTTPPPPPAPEGSFRDVDATEQDSAQRSAREEEIENTDEEGKF